MPWSLPAPAPLCCLLAAVSWGAGCTRQSPPEKPDAGHAADAGRPDSGPPDSGPAGPQPIGGNCASDSECASSHCDTLIDGGYCIESCTDNTNCPDASVCEQISGRQAYCVSLCRSDSDCKSGQFCQAGSDICVPAPGCSTDQECPTGDTCNTANGFCSGALEAASTIGATCTSSTACTSGPEPTCLTSTEGFPSGYCSSLCSATSMCGANSVCVPNLFQGGSGATYGGCLGSCTSDSQCRSGYNCSAYMGLQFCYPNCMSDADCIDSTQSCDTATGVCVTVDGGADAGSDAGPPDAGSDAGAPEDAGFDAGVFVWDGGYPAPFPSPPQVQDEGGPVIAAPNLVPVFFANDDPTIVASIADFDSRIGSTSYWHAVTSEYGVAAATSAAPIMLSEIATGTLADTSIQAWINAEIANGTLPMPDSNTLYVLHYPPYITIELEGGHSCRSFGGYHNGFADSALRRNIAYAVVPRRSGSGLTDLQIETQAESHELVEASTDPLPGTDPAYLEVDGAHAQYSLATGGGTELGDMCEIDPSSFTTFSELPYRVQRTWSNNAAAAGSDPCVPELPGEIYFSAAAVMSDPLNVGGAAVFANGIAVAPGGSATVPVELWSEADAGPWSLGVQDLSGSGSTFSYSLSPNMGNNGDRASLTVTSSAQTPAGTEDVFILESSNGSVTHWTIGLSGQ